MIVSSSCRRSYDLRGVALTAFFVCAGFEKGRPQFDLQRRVDHLNDVRGRLARDEVQITPGAFGKMHDLMGLVHNDRRRPVLFEQTQMQFAKEHFAP